MAPLLQIVMKLGSVFAMPLEFSLHGNNSNTYSGCYPCHDIGQCSASPSLGCRKLIRSQTGMLAQQLVELRKDVACNVYVIGGGVNKTRAEANNDMSRPPADYIKALQGM